eukprot:COSAG02_NODE_70371_length_196_cov_35.608247_1_plen_30_part_01
MSPADCPFMPHANLSRLARRLLLQSPTSRH